MKTIINHADEDARKFAEWMFKHPHKTALLFCVFGYCVGSLFR